MPDGDITQLLLSWRSGDRSSADQLFARVYDELHAIAHRQLRRRRPGETLSTTALVHEAYLKLVDHSRLEVKDRNHFFALAARAMRQILVDYARRRSAQKRGGGVPTALLDEGRVPVATRAAEVVAIDDALIRLAALDERLSQVVELRFFGGLSVEEAAEVMGCSDRTIKRDWRKARAYLYRDLKEAGLA